MVGEGRDQRSESSGSELDDSEQEDAPEEEEVAAAADPTHPTDPKSDRAFVLPSMFKGRPATVWFDYPVYMEMPRQEGREHMVELTAKG